MIECRRHSTTLGWRTPVSVDKFDVVLPPRPGCVGNYSAPAAHLEATNNRPPHPTPGRAAARGGRRRWVALLHDAVRQRRVAARADACRADPVARGAGSASRCCESARLCASARHRAPRHQAGERAAQRRDGNGRGLRGGARTSRRVDVGRRRRGAHANGHTGPTQPRHSRCTTKRSRWNRTR